MYLRLCNTILIALSISILIVPCVNGQDGDVGNFDIDRVYQDALRSDDDDLTAAGSNNIAGFTGQPENYALVILRITGYLVVVTAVIFGIAWLIRRFGVAGAPKVSGGHNMDTIETLYFGQDRGIALVRVADAVYLLGHTSNGIVMLEKIEGEKAIELIASSKGGTSIMNFKDAFNNFLGKMKKT